MEEEDERIKIDLKQHTLPPVSKRYLFRIILYVVLLTGVCSIAYYLYNRRGEAKVVKEPEPIEEIRGVTISE
jgi:hypothetical protein